MSIKELIAPSVVDNPAALIQLAAMLGREAMLGVDTESNSLFAYREQVCLVQLSSPRVDALVDPLAVPDLAPLGSIFRDPAIEKVFHAAEYDLLCLRRDFGFEFSNIFDTMLAARILGRPALGLGDLLGAEFGVRLDKRYQRANWGARPMAADLMDYARLDTHYLIPLRQRLRHELEEAGRHGLAEEDFQRLCGMAGSEEEGEDDAVQQPEVREWQRLRGSSDLTPRQAAVLQELCTWRDQTAQAMNRPLFKVIGDQALVAVAAGCPTLPAELKHLRGISPRMIERFGRQLLLAVQRGLKAPPLYPTRPPRPDERFLIRLDILKRWRLAEANKMRVPSDVVLPRDLLLALARRNPQSWAELEEVLKQSPWRLEHFGEQVLAALARKKTVVAK